MPTEPEMSTTLPPSNLSELGDPTSTEASAFEKLWALANNLWWSWHPECDQLFRDIDPIRWRQLDHNPVALLREFSPDQAAQRATEWFCKAGSITPIVALRSI